MVIVSNSISHKPDSLKGSSCNCDVCSAFSNRIFVPDWQKRDVPPRSNSLHRTLEIEIMETFTFVIIYADLQNVLINANYKIKFSWRLIMNEFIYTKKNNKILFRLRVVD